MAILRRSWISSVLPLAWLLLSPPSIFAAEDDDEAFLRWQAEQAQAIDSGEVEGGGNANSESRASGNGISRSAFENLLRESFFGTYIFYKKLSDSDRADALGLYRETGSMTQTRALIMRRFMHR